MRYLVITYIRKADGKIDEQLEVVKNLKERDLTTGNVILDFKEKKVQKSVVQGQQVQTSWDIIVEHYRQVYPDYIAELEKLQGE
jgi:hypothetical protein